MIRVSTLRPVLEPIVVVSGNPSINPTAGKQAGVLLKHSTRTTILDILHPVEATFI